MGSCFSSKPAKEDSATEKGFSDLTPVNEQKFSAKKDRSQSEAKIELEAGSPQKRKDKYKDAQNLGDILEADEEEVGAKTQCRVDWGEVDHTPNYVYYLVPLVSKDKPSFLACADEYIHTFEVLPVGAGDKAMVSHRESIQAYESGKIINMACLNGDSQVVTCSRDPVIKLWDLRTQGLSTQLTGHDMSVTTVDAVSERSLVSGSRDQTTRVWDLETQKQVSMRKIDRNVVTCLKWLDENCFLQCSEDLTLRKWDIR